MEVKKVLVTGGSGYVGNYIIKKLAQGHPNIQVVGMNRSGKSRGDPETDQLKNVTFIKGDCLKTESL